MKLKIASSVIALMALLGSPSAVRATTSVAWTTPADGSTYEVGTTVAPVGQASSIGTIGGTGLDLALVIDVSGSMGTTSSGKTRLQWAKEAAVALVNGLPQNSTAVSIITFDSVAHTVKVLTQLNSDKAAVISAINGLGTSSNTAIGKGIQAATAELTSVRHTAGRSQQMVVLSDGENNVAPVPYNGPTDAAIAAGVDAIHAVGVPGHSVSTMKAIAGGADDNYATVGDNYGVYTSVSDLTTLEGIFDGTAGNLVGLDHIDLTTPDGVVHHDYPTDGLGNFTAPSTSIEFGPQTWTVTAYGEDGTSASANLTLYGERKNGVPEAGTTLLLLGMGLCSVVGLRRRMK